ncbi:MAG TPA: hypothetical protein VFC29_06375 [Candidatus Limnocylindrales bacterium]|nr:hypothetical protein [Candidatus Limnocylindrales bacterium]
MQRVDWAGVRRTAQTSSLPNADRTGRSISGTAVAIGRYAPEAAVWICDSVAGAAPPDENRQHGAGASGPFIAIDVCGINLGGQQE